MPEISTACAKPLDLAFCDPIDTGCCTGGRTRHRVEPGGTRQRGSRGRPAEPEVKNRSLAEKTILKAMTKAGHDAQKDWEAFGSAPAHGGPGVDLRELDGEVCCGHPADLPCRRQLLEDKKSVSVAVLCSHPLLTGHPCLALFG